MPAKGKKAGVIFEDAYKSFIAVAERKGDVVPLQIRNYRHKFSVLKPHLDGVTLPEIDITWLEKLRDARKKPHPKTGKVISNVTIKKDVMFIRVVLRHAVERDKTLARLPEFPSFRGTKWKAKHKKRPYLPPEMWRKVKKAAFRRIEERASTESRQRCQNQSVAAGVVRLRDDLRRWSPSR